LQINESNIQNLINKIDKKLFEVHPREIVIQQLHNLLSGSHYIDLIKPAKVGDGIIKIDETQENTLFEIYDKAKLTGRISKFIPASGAATRMFSQIHSAIDKFSEKNLHQIKEFSESDNSARAIVNLIENIESLAFYYDLLEIAFFKKIELNDLIRRNPIEFLKMIINSDGLNYENKPKAILKFHKYPNHSRTAFIEHLYESAFYQSDAQNNVSIHFTISEDHFNLFKDEEKTISNFNFLKEYNFRISYSYQKNSTDSIVLTSGNELYLTSDNQPLFRPAGHGALLENLNDLKADIVFIKNIDNVCVDRLKPTTVKYKKLIAGLLLMIQKQVFEYLTILEKKSDNEDLRKQIMSFSEKLLNIKKPDGFVKWNTEQQREFLFNTLNRPIRVCGVVKNEGEPGGAPFWVKDENGNISLQIVEKSQINLEDEKQRLIFNNSTHFNPVDIVAGLRNYKGTNFDLLKFRDENSYMIVSKNIGSTEIKSLELPGLWNGAMADWISVFVEVPIETFNPVKELTDFLRKGHIEKIN
jgi:hypothetical protein